MLYQQKLEPVLLKYVWKFKKIEMLKLTNSKLNLTEISPSRKMDCSVRMDVMLVYLQVFVCFQRVFLRHALLDANSDVTLHQ